MRSKKQLFLISLIVILSMAFLPSEILFQDDFEGHLQEAKLNRDYQVWESGAVLEIFLEDEIINSGDNALGVKVISPNPINESRYGSVYRTFEFLQGNWIGGLGVRFWVNNPNDTALLLSFNFKERHREYWAVAEEGLFYLEEEDGVVCQQSIFYSNLSIPAEFSGFVIIPFTSFAVPAWNTARSNQKIDLNRVESYAVSVLAGENTPFNFYIDDIQVFGQTSFYEIPIEGPALIEIPPSGALLETFHADVMFSDGQRVETPLVTWSIEAPHDPNLQINDEGVLRIPAEAQPGEVTLTATWQTPEMILQNSLQVSLTGTNDGEVELAPAPSSAPTGQDQSTEYDRFSTQFDVWTMNNRPLFVGLLIIGVTGFLSVLSTIEHKLK